MKSMSLVGDKSLASVLTEEKISDCFQSMKRSASVIKSTQGATYYAVAKCATTILKKVLFPTTETVPVSVLLSAAMQNELDCPPLFMSVPAVLTNKGAFPVSDFTCSPDELAALKVSAQRLAGYCKF
jgi:malate/lactate dehydrogenase